MKLKHDVALRFDGIAIDKCGLVAPFVESLRDGGDKVSGAEDLVYVCDVAVFGDGGFDADGSGGASGNLGGFWIDAGDEFADDHFFVVIEGPAGVRGGHVHGALDVHG